VTVLASSAPALVWTTFFFVVFFGWVWGKITGTGNCPHCRKGMKSGATVCHHCGRPRH
jgi:hypothetical protein